MYVTGNGTTTYNCVTCTLLVMVQQPTVVLHVHYWCWYNSLQLCYMYITGDGTIAYSCVTYMYITGNGATAYSCVTCTLLVMVQQPTVVLHVQYWCWYNSLQLCYMYITGDDTTAYSWVTCTLLVMVQLPTVVLHVHYW